MITSATLYIWLAFILVITLPLRYLGDVVPNSNITEAIAEASGYISPINSFLPVNTLLIIFGVLIAYEAILITYKVIKWVYNKLPGVN